MKRKEMEENIRNPASWVCLCAFEEIRGVGETVTTPDPIKSPRTWLTKVVYSYTVIILQTRQHSKNPPLMMPVFLSLFNWPSLSPRIPTAFYLIGTQPGPSSRTLTINRVLFLPNSPISFSVAKKNDVFSFCCLCSTLTRNRSLCSTLIITFD